MRWSAWGVELARGETRDMHVLVMVEELSNEGRAPLTLNLVLDRSGSMKGAPLLAAVEAALQLVDLCKPDDYVGLVLFDGVAEQRVQVCAMDARGKKAMRDALHGIQTGRGTALYQAIDLAAKGLQRILIPGRRPRLLLLTDGEPSVGNDTQDAFEALGTRLAKLNLSVHALGLARHYVAEILTAITQPSGNAFEHVDGPEGLAEAMGGVAAHLFGHVGSDCRVRIQPRNCLALACRHGFPTQLEHDALLVSLGDVSAGFSRRVLFSGSVVPHASWGATVDGSWVERGDVRQLQVPLEIVDLESKQGKLVLGMSYELDLVAAESAAWLSLARKELERAEQQLDEAEAHLDGMSRLGLEQSHTRRHEERLGDLRIAVERGEGDFPLLIRRAQSAKAGTSVSQMLPVPRNRRSP